MRRTSFGVNAPWRGCAEIYFWVWEVNVDRSIERRRTIRIRRSALTSAKLDDIEKPAIKIAETVAVPLGEVEVALNLRRFAGGA